jgi:hypothetical protein
LACIPCLPVINSFEMSTHWWLTFF